MPGRGVMVCGKLEPLIELAAGSGDGGPPCHFALEQYQQTAYASSRSPNRWPRRCSDLSQDWSVAGG